MAGGRWGKESRLLGRLLLAPRAARRPNVWGRGVCFDDCAEAARVHEGEGSAVWANVLAEGGEARKRSRRHEADGVLCEPPLDVGFLPDLRPKRVCCDVRVHREQARPVPGPLFVDVSEASLSRDGCRKDDDVGQRGQ